MGWTKMGVNDWAYSTRDDVWAEVVSDSSGKWHFEITNGKNTFHKSGELSDEATAKASARKIYDDLVAKPPKLATPEGDTYTVKLPGQNKEHTTKAHSALQALGFVLHRNPDYSYNGLMVGSDFKNLRLIFSMVKDLSQIKKATQASGPLTCEEFFEGYIDGSRDLDALIDEMYRSDDFSSDQMFEFMKKEAKKENVTLTDVDSFSYDDFFYNVYKNTEKGLS